jgi:hypothetical protein
MDRSRKVELFEEIRRKHAKGAYDSGGSKKAGRTLANVRPALASAIPPERKLGDAKEAQAESCNGVHGRDPASRPDGSVHAAAPGASHLGAIRHERREATVAEAPVPGSANEPVSSTEEMPMP